MKYIQTEKKFWRVWDKDPEYMIEYTYMVDNATDEIIWIQCESEE